MQRYKSIKFRPDDHQVIADAAEELQNERGGKVYLPSFVLESVEFFRKHRNETHVTAGTPGGKVAAGSGDTQAQPKGVITK